METIQILKRAARFPSEALLKLYVRALPRTELDPNRVRRILVFAYHGLGNFIMYTPALKLLRERYPEARIDLQVGNNTGCEEVLAGAGLFDNIYNLPYSAGAGAWIARLAEIRRTRYDVTINEFHSHSWPLALLVAFSGAPARAGHVSSPGWPHKFSRYSFIFNAPVRMQEDQHEIDRYLNLISTLDVTRMNLSEARPFVHLNDADREFARSFLRAAFSNAGTRTIGIQPGTSPAMRWKQWPVDRYRELIRLLISEQPEIKIVLFGSPAEAAINRELAFGVEKNVIVAAGKTSIKQVAALIEQCDLLICNDSGLMHAAVAVGTPVVAIYGPTDVNRTAPLGQIHSIIRHELPCSPCFKLEGDEQVRTCPHHDCLMTITPGEVARAVGGRTVRLGHRAP